MSDLKGSITRGFGKAKFNAGKYSPEITLVSSIIFGGIALGTAIYSTLKADEVIDKHQEKIDKIHTATELAESDDTVDYTPEDAKKDTVKAYIQTGFGFAKLYAPTIIFAGLSITCSIASHRILTKRNAALALTAASLKKAWDEYRERVVRDLGSDMDRHFLYDTVEETIEKKVTDNKGKEKIVPEVVQVPTKASVYSRFFDEANKFYTKDGAASYIKLRGQLLDFNRHIVRDGYGFLNNGYGKLGFPITIIGQQAGWVFDPRNPESSLCQIEGFGTVRLSSNGSVYLDEAGESDAVRAFRNGYERALLIEFKNLRDNIYDDIQLIDSSISVV